MDLSPTKDIGINQASVQYSSKNRYWLCRSLSIAANIFLHLAKIYNGLLFAIGLINFNNKAAVSIMVILLYCPEFMIVPANNPPAKFYLLLHLQHKM